jgi:Leucine-rich repeat (LRR) protein
VGLGRRITRLNLSHNKLARLPAALEYLELVTEMILSFNVLSDLSGPDWARLRSLTTLDVSNNVVCSRFPCSILSLSLF